MGIRESKERVWNKREYHIYALAWILILFGWLAVINYLSNKFFVRLDLTEGKAYTLSPATKEVLKNLPEPVWIRAYFSADLPAAIKAELSQIRDLLEEYRIYGRGKVKIKFINPDADPDLQNELRSRGIYPVPFQVRGASEFSIKQGYMALEIQYLDKREVFQNAVALKDFEYALTSTILKFSSEKETAVAFLTGDGEPDIYKDLTTLREAIERQYKIQQVNLKAGDTIPDDVEVVFVIAPNSLSDWEKFLLDQFLMRGGKLIFLIDGVEVAEQYMFAFPKEDGLDEMLEHYGINRNHDLVMDVINERVAMKQGPWQIIQNYPLWVKVNIPILQQLGLAVDHPIINQLDSIVLPWASSLQFAGSSKEVKVWELLKTSPKSWVQTGSFTLDPSRLPPPLPVEGMGEKVRTLAILLSGKFTSFFKDKEIPKPEDGAQAPKEKLDESPKTSILVVGNSRFVRDDYITIGDSNLDFVLNTLDWMTWGGKLIGVRSRVSLDRPFKQDISLFDAITAKYFGPFLPPVLIIIFGVIRFQSRRREKRIWTRAQKGESK